LQQNIVRAIVESSVSRNERNGNSDFLREIVRYCHGSGWLEEVSLAV